MSNESEVIFHRGDRDDDEENKVRHHDNDTFWVVESYETKTTKAMIALDAEQIPSRVDGHLFRVDAKKLILFIAESSGLNVEFRTRKRQTLSPEKAEARRLRMAAMNAAQRVKT